MAVNGDKSGLAGWGECDMSDMCDMSVYCMLMA